MHTTFVKPTKAFPLIALGLAFAAMGIYVGDADDAPGAAVVGMLLMVVGVLLGLKAARNRLPAWAARTALAAGVVVAAFAAFITHDVVVRAALFQEPEAVPAAVGSTPSPQYAVAVERARAIVRAAVIEQNLPGVSVAVGVPAGGLAKEPVAVWAEGFGWRDVATHAPVTPDTRFNIGTAASAVTDSVVSLGLKNTGAEPADEWSPGHIGEPDDDFPLFTLTHNVILRPLGVSAPAQPLAGDRATFYVPRSDDDPRRGRRLMYMRHLACCANGMAFYSTPLDLVRFALATHPVTVNGELAGGTVMTLLTRDSVVVAVASNITHANTSSVAQRISVAFTPQTP